MRPKERYRDLLQDPRWQKVRLEVFNRDNWSCLLCNSKDKTLVVHHEKYEGSSPWETSKDYLSTVCTQCHGILHKKETFFIEITNFSYVLNVFGEDSLNGNMSAYKLGQALADEVFKLDTISILECISVYYHESLDCFAQFTLESIKDNTLYYEFNGTVGS
jgi:hypothetical protein